MNRNIQKRMVSKTYRAIVSGHILKPRHFLLDAPISENAKNKKKRSVSHFIGDHKHEGRAAITECVVEGIGRLRCARDGAAHAASSLRIRLWTGRRHQIRLHLAHIGHPVVGDALYSDLEQLNPSLFDRMYLDAHQVHIKSSSNSAGEISVQTDSDRRFRELLSDATWFDNSDDAVCLESGSLMMDSAKYSRSVLIPFVVPSDGSSNVLVATQGICESKLSDNGHVDAAQNLASAFLKQHPYFARYLMRESLFCPKHCAPKSAQQSSGSKDGDNVKYVVHHLASNLRRNAKRHLTVLSEPNRVYFFVPFKPEILRDAQATQARWMSLADAKDSDVHPVCRSVLSSSHPLI